MMSSHLFLLFFFYSLQGVPYGLQSKFLPLILRSQGSSLTSLGLYKLLYLPWVFKSAYAPFVDSFSTKRRWLQCSIAALLFCSAFLALHLDRILTVGPVSSELFLLAACLLTFNFAAATQDIAVDSLAIAILSHSELASGNTAQVVGYKFGAVIGGGIFTWLSSSIDLRVLFLGLCLFYATGFAVATYYRAFDRVSEFEKGKASVKGHKSKNVPQSACNGKHPNEESSSYWTVLRMALLDSPSTPVILLLLLVYKLGEQGAMNMLPLMLLDAGSPIASVGFWTGIVGQITSTAGSFFAGVFLMNATLLVSGTITTTVFTLMMECTRKEVPPKVRATHYTILSTAEILGKLLFATVAMSLTDVIGYAAAYVIFFLLSALPLWIIFTRKNTLLI
ncbi:unnamed protein product [Schistocephalus solidus]|uniref:Major facilitator superfamily domain-containing protein 3 n=1 Tax=Schistocephalus solidus TaxID=70667 RepID=A0A3P7EDC0_SCHSO|nr:unnamed protein product [Schistocephalus solidus]